MPKFLIIDGSSMLSTSYYGNLPKSILFAKTDEEKERHYPEILHTSDGKYTNAMFTMLRTLLAVYKKVKPEYVAFTFDMTRDTFRRTQLGADFYKANRKETAQPSEGTVRPDGRASSKSIGCPVFMSPGLRGRRLRRLPGGEIPGAGAADLCAYQGPRLFPAGKRIHPHVARRYEETSWRL